MKRFGKLSLLSVAALALATSVSFAQQAASPQEVDKDVALLRQDIRAQKKQLVAANMSLTPDAATKFWPLYDQYTVELVKINDSKYAILKEYATNFNSLTDDQCDRMSQDLIKVDESVAQLRLKYIPIFKAAIGSKSTTRFIQIDRRLLGVIDLQLASIIPLTQP
jgi:hypothetical protein